MKPLVATSRLLLASALAALVAVPRASRAEEAPPAAPPQPAPALQQVSAPQPGDTTVDKGPASSAAQIQRAPVAPTKPQFALGSDTSFVAPILALAGGLSVERIVANPNPNRESRNTTVALTRFGLEGRLGPYVSFRSEFERNIRAHGSGVWEGTASFSVRDQVIRLERWGATAEAGIVVDPASVDFFSLHVGDLLMADKYTRDPLLYSGFNRGQGLQVRYGWQGLTAGLSYTAANPLSSSAAFMVGGTFGGNTRLWERPLSNYRVGQPDDSFHFEVLSPSLSWESPLVDVKAAAQLFNTNYETASRTDPHVNGFNLRGSARLKLEGRAPVPFRLTPYVNVSRVQNDVLNNTAGYADQLLATPFTSLTYSAGVDLTVLGRSGIGVSLAQVRDGSPSYVPATGTSPAGDRVIHTTLTYLNVGASYFLTDNVALGARFASYDRRTDASPRETDFSVISTLRLVL